MGQIADSTSSLGGSLDSLLTAEDIVPGSAPSYQLCKTIYLYHPLGAKMADAPIKMAMSQAREISVPGAPEDVVKAFNEEWKRIKADDFISNTAGLSRVYGIASVAVGCVGKPADQALDLKQLQTGQLYFNVLDPLNTAGSLVLDQDPRSPMFQKHKGIVVGGEAFHPSRCCVVMNEKPIYIAYTPSAFGFVGRSVYQRALYPLKTYVQSMITDDMVTQKAGLLIIKAQAPGSIVDRLMQGIAAIKRTMLKVGRTGNVITIAAGNTTNNAEEVETLNMMNVDGAAGFARTNVLKNIATAGDMPAVLLENETLTEGFGEGSEDAKIIAGYIDGIRKWLQPLYDFFDPIVMERAWNPEFFEILRSRYPEYCAGMEYDVALYRWKNAFHAEWPNLLKEPESEAVEREKVKLSMVIATAQLFMGQLNPVPEEKAKLLMWVADSINKNKTLFAVPLQLDWQAISEIDPMALLPGADGDAPTAEDEPKMKSPSASLRMITGAGTK